MSTPITLTLRLELDGRAVHGFPIVAGLTVADLHAFRLAHSPEPDIYEPLPIESLGRSPQILMIRPDGVVKLRIGGQTTSNLPVEVRGAFLLWGAGEMTKDDRIRTDVQTHADGFAAG